VRLVQGGKGYRGDGRVGREGWGNGESQKREERMERVSGGTREGGRACQRGKGQQTHEDRHTRGGGGGHYHRRPAPSLVTLHNSQKTQQQT
jgi:hypothetical protein